MNAHLAELFAFLDGGVSPFHVVAQAAARLEQAGFTRLQEGTVWQLEAPGQYFLTRNGSSLVAFRLPGKDFTGWRISAAHCDSPTFRVKPCGSRTLAGWQRLAVEGYGGLNLPSWLDRPLGLAGRVLVRTPAGVETRLYRSSSPACLIPSLCVHFDEARGKGRALVPSADLQPVWGPEGREEPLAAVARELGVERQDILDADLTLFPFQKATVYEEAKIFSSPRIDDLECAWACLDGFVNSEAEPRAAQALCLFDNEEVGSSTRQGAESFYLAQVLDRVNEALGRSRQQEAAALANTLLLSADNGHAAHPNHPDKADPENPVILGRGILLKYSANQRYTTSGLTGALAGEIFRRAGVPFQAFTNKADLPGGSTLGNLLGHTVSVPMADIGAAQWAMHSCVETASTEDALSLRKALAAFYSTRLAQTADGNWSLE